MITNFDQLVGNKRILVPLQRALAKGTLKNLTILGGVYGTGKSTASWIAGMTLTCENPKGANPCCECEICKANMSSLPVTGNSLYVKTHDMTSIKTHDQMNELIDSAFSIKGVASNSVHILAELQELSSELQNRILEQLDRLDKSIYIIANCTSVHRINDALKSRTVPYIFTRLLREESRVLATRELSARGLTNPSRELIDTIVSHANGIPRDIVNLIEHMFATDSSPEELMGFLGDVPNSVFVSLVKMLKEDTTQYFKYIDDLLNTYPIDTLLTSYKEFVSDLKFLQKIGESSSFTSDEVHDLLELEESFINKILSNSLRLSNISSEADVRLNFISLGESVTRTVMSNNKEKVIQQKVEADRSRTFVTSVDSEANSTSDAFTGMKDLRRMRNESLD